MFPAFGPVVYLFSPLHSQVGHSHTLVSPESIASLSGGEESLAQTHRTECWSDLEKPSETMQDRCLNLGTTDILGQTTLCCRTRPVHCRTLGSISGVPLDAHWEHPP